MYCRYGGAHLSVSKETSSGPNSIGPDGRTRVSRIKLNLQQETWCHTYFRSPGHREVIHQRFCPASHYRSSYYRNTPSWRTAPQPLSRPHWSARRAQHLSSRLNSMLVSLRVTGGDRLLIFWNSTAPSPATLASVGRTSSADSSRWAILPYDTIQ